MGDKTAIEWTEATWNPTVGCTRVSPGCKHCYAFALHDMRHAAHLAGRNVPAQYSRPFTELQTLADRLDQPLHWKRPRRIFVNSVSDLFHRDVPDAFIDQVFAVMYECQWHTFQVLTKRAERAYAYLADMGPRVNAIAQEAWRRLQARAPEKAALVSYHEVVADLAAMWPLPNVWCGVSIENRDQVPRIQALLRTPAAVRFVSAEPLLEAIDVGLRNWVGINRDDCRLDWVIAGGESGPHARPMHPQWVRLLRDDCQAARVPFFFKQWGEWQLGSDPRPSVKNRIVLSNGHYWPHPDEATYDDRMRWNKLSPTMMAMVGKKAAGRLLDGRTWDDYPETEATPCPS